LTFGIDVSSNQTGFSMKKAKAEGAEFVIVKAGGFNITPMYSSGVYPKFVDDAKAAGLRVGHYWVIGKGDPVAQAEFFVKHLHSFNKNTDILALDNEKLDRNGTLWNDTQAAAFLKRVIDLTGIDPKRVYHYSYSYYIRTAAPWTKTRALGVRWWVASYGNNPYSKTHKPTASSIPNLAALGIKVSIHQYSSAVPIAGWPRIDGNYSELSIKEIFGPFELVPAPITEPIESLIEIPAGTEIHQGAEYYFGTDLYNVAKLEAVNNSLVHSIWDAEAGRWNVVWQGAPGQPKWKDVRYVMQFDGNFVGYRTGPIRPKIVVWVDNSLRLNKVPNSHLTLLGSSYTMAVVSPDTVVTWRSK
jgi:hypothetical protein